MKFEAPGTISIQSIRERLEALWRFRPSGLVRLWINRITREWYVGTEPEYPRLGWDPIGGVLLERIPHPVAIREIASTLFFASPGYVRIPHIGYCADSGHGAGDCIEDLT